MWERSCPTYIINLLSAPKRWEKISTQCKNLHINPIRINAIKGSDLSYREKNNLVSKNCAKYCPNATIGVTLSHQKTWKRAHLDFPSLPILICEDDCEFVPNFIEKFNEYSKEVPNDWDILYLGCLLCQPKVSAIPNVVLSLLNHKNKNAKQISKHVIIPSFAFGSHCYCVSPQGMKKLVSWTNINEQVDYYLNRKLKDGTLNSYAFNPVLATQSVSFSAGSMMANPFPKGPNFILDKVKIAPEISWAYGLSYPHAKFGPFEVNAWIFVFFGLGFILGLRRKKYYILLLLLVPDYQSSNLWFALLFYAVGYTLGSTLGSTLGTTLGTTLVYTLKS